MKIHLKLVEELEKNHLEDIVNILNTDKKLNEHLKSGNKSFSCSEFVEYNKQWEINNNAEIFAIILVNEAIGLISMSQIDVENKEAKIGYWITSKYWNKGYTSAAFQIILDVAKEKNIHKVSCSIDKDNKQSKAIWGKFNAKFKKKGNKILPSIKLNH